MQFTYKLYILYINFINIYKSTVYTCIVYLKNHTLTIQKLYITIIAVIKHAPRHTKAIFSLLIYVGAMTNQKKIIKISNGNECVGSGYPVGGGGHPVSVVFNGRQEDRKAHLYIIPIILNICIFPGFFLLFLLVFCIQSTPETGNRMIIHYLFSFFFVLFLLHAL